MRSLDEITYERICEVMGEPRFLAELASSNLVALVNWTMVPNMTAIFEALLSRALPRLPAASPRTFFFDLADPEKRSTDDLCTALAAIARFERFGRVALGLNLKKAQQVAAAQAIVPTAVDEAGLREMCAAIRAKLSVATVMVHPRESAACATAAATWWIPGPYTAQTKVTTGAGDHFNSGFATGQLLGLTPEACLTLGVATSGYYVRTAASPSLVDLETFLANWR
jgi:sugar/nucleoside kinase (ribokinase family)